MKRQTGHYQTISTVGETCRACLPLPLPPYPPLQIDAQRQDLIDRALLALGKLDSIATLLPDTSLFLYMYIRKEAVLSSQIEGTQSSLSDLLLFESEQVPGVPLEDVQEVSNYVAAITHGLNRLREGFPLSLRLFREIHAQLLAKGRGSQKMPGEFRRSQNWVGGTRPGNALFVPPPPEQVVTCLGELEKFLHDQPARTPLLIKAALAHVQFETIHPFLDGNGRLGRLLITLILCVEGALKEPILYLSLYFKTHRLQYYDLLQEVRTAGHWEKWIDFFMQGVTETALLAVDTAQRLLKLFETDRVKINGLGKSASSSLRVHHVLQQHPLLSIVKAATLTGLSIPTVTVAFDSLAKLGIVKEVTGQKRNRLYTYQQYVSILNEGTQLN
jgi:Fic family protein